MPTTPVHRKEIEGQRACNNFCQSLSQFSWPSSATIVSTAIAVALGTFAERYLALLPLKLIAGIGFIAIGAWTIGEYYKLV
jgi:hypothetical protein